MKTTWDDLLLDVEELEDKLHKPMEFAQDHAQPYHAAAATIARRIILPLMPEHHDPDRWRIKVERVVERVTAELMFGGELRLTVAVPESSRGYLAPKDQRPAEQSVTHADVLEWIQAGEKNLPEGKRITNRDRDVMAKAGGGDAGYKALASIVMRAYYSSQPVGSYVRLRRVIQKFLFGLAEDSGDPILDAVATAWVEHFSVRQHRDMKAYVAKLCREF